jgi:predicted metalloenzyme YecM
MTRKELELHQKIAEMEADMKVTALAFAGILEKLGIDVADFKEMDENAIRKKSPTIAKNISKAFISNGDSFGQALNKAIACGPIMSKYSYLFNENDFGNG